MDEKQNQPQKDSNWGRWGERTLMLIAFSMNGLVLEDNENPKLPCWEWPESLREKAKKVESWEKIVEADKEADW